MSVAPVQVPVAFLFICTAAQVGSEVGSDGSSWACVNTRGKSGYFPPARGFFYCPLFLTQNRPLKNIGHSHSSPVAQRVLCICLLTKYFCVMACVYCDSYKLGKKHECAGGNTSAVSQKCSLESSPDNRLQKHWGPAFPYTADLKLADRTQTSHFVQTCCTNFAVIPKTTHRPEPLGSLKHSRDTTWLNRSRN